MALPILLLAAVLSATGVAAEKAEAPAPAGRPEDAADFHGLVATRAQGLGAGEIALHVQDLALVGLHYGFTDQVQGSVLTTLPLTDQIPGLTLVRARISLQAGEKSCTSAMAEAGIGWPHDGQLATTLGVGLAHDQRFGRRSRTILSGTLSARVGLGGEIDDLGVGGSAALLIEIGAQLPVRGPVSVLGELLLPTLYEGGDFDLGPTFAAPLGLRLATGPVSVDVGLVIGQAGALGLPDLLGTLPWVAITGRLGGVK